MLGIIYYRNELEEKEEIIDTQQEELEKRHKLLLQDITEELKRTREKYAIQRAKGNYEQRCEIDKKIYNILNALPDKLKIGYPGITYKEIMYCCLFMLNLPIYELCFIMDYKQTSLYKFKQRLTKKLGFDTVKDLESMLEDKVNF